MANEGATQFGSIKAVLTLDKSDYVRGLIEAGVQADELGKHDPTIRVDVDGVPQAKAQMASLERSAQSLERTNVRAGRSAGALVTAVVALGPALVPIGAAALGVGAALGAMGVTGALAIAGIKQEMEEGTALGLEFQEVLDDAKGSVSSLSRTAAAGVLAPLQDAVRDLNARMPELTRITDELGAITGRTAANLTGGLLSAFVALSPLVQDVSMYVLDLSRRFEQAMSGPGVVAFAEYVRSVFPQVMSAVEDIAAAAVHLVTSLAPLGMGTLSMLQTFSTLISAIPTDVLATTAQLAGSVFLGFKTWQGLSGLVDGLGAALGRVGVAGGRAATALRGLQIASGVIGVALAGLSLVMSAMSRNSAEAQAATNDLTDALIRSNGAIDEGVRLAALKNAQDDGAIRLAGLLGISTDKVVDAYLGQVGALGDLEAARDRAMRKTFEEIQAGKDVGHSVGDVNTAYLELVNVLGEAGVNWDKSKAGLQQHRDALNGTATSTSAATLETQRLAAMYGVSVPTYQAAADGQKKVAEQSAAARVQMMMQNDAAGLLKQALDLLNGKTLDLASAQTSSASATMSAVSALDESNGKLKLNSKEGIAARQSIEAKARADQALALATATATGKTEDSTKSLADSKAQLEKTLKSQGLLTKEVQGYIDKLYQVPEVVLTDAEMKTAAAKKKVDDLKAYINTLTGKTVTVTVVTKYLDEVARSARTGRGRLEGNATGGIIGLKGGGMIPGYAGGTLVGPGTGTSDSILAMVRESGRLLRVSNGEFVSTDASRRRNQGALEAGNRGAKLQVAGRGSGEVRLDDLTIDRLAAAMARVKVKASVSSSAWESGFLGRVQ